jgi:hypothetical protein
MKMKLDADNEYGKVILSNQELGRDVRRAKWAMLTTAAVVAVASLYMVSGASRQQQPLLLDTRTGQIITTYKHVLTDYTTAERAQLARLAYEGLRRRTGVPAVDAEHLASWGGHISKPALAAWARMGERWSNPSRVEYDFRRTIRVLAVTPDISTPYAFTIEALETDIIDARTLTEKTYRVRLTLIFSDPKIDGQSRIESAILHSEEQV